MVARLNIIAIQPLLRQKETKKEYCVFICQTNGFILLLILQICIMS